MAVSVRDVHNIRAISATQTSVGNAKTAMIRTRTAGTRFRRRFAASTQSGLDVWRSDMAICWGGGGIKQSFRNKPQSKVKAERACVASCFHMQGWFRAGLQRRRSRSPMEAPRASHQRCHRALRASLVDLKESKTIRRLHTTGDEASTPAIPARSEQAPHQSTRRLRLGGRCDRL